MKEQIRELALRCGFKVREQPNGEMDLNPYVYRFAQNLLDNIWISLDDGLPKCGKTTKFLAKNGIQVISKLHRFTFESYGVEALDGEIWDLHMFSHWQPYEDEDEDDEPSD